MHRVHHTTILALAALALVGSACQPAGTPLGDIQNKQLSVDHIGLSPGQLTATLNYYSAEYGCALRDDAFARLNGQSVPLFPGQEYTVPPMGDDGQVGCHQPSVTLDPIPSGLSAPWTLEIGDASEIVSVTFGPEAFNPLQIGPVVTSSLTSSYDPLIIQISGGDSTPADPVATFTAADGRSTSIKGSFVGPGIVNDRFVERAIEFASAVAPGWPPGPIAVAIDTTYSPYDQALDCQNATCSVTSLAANSVSMTSTFTVPLACTPVKGVCS
jgi:hypothetical protein